MLDFCRCVQDHLRDPDPVLCLPPLDVAAGGRAERLAKEGRRRLN